MTEGALAARLTGDILDFWARQTPHRPAILCEGEEVSFSALDRRANRVTHALLDFGFCQLKAAPK